MHQEALRRSPSHVKSETRDPAFVFIARQVAKLTGCSDAALPECVHEVTTAIENLLGRSLGGTKTTFTSGLALLHRMQRKLQLALVVMDQVRKLQCAHVKLQGKNARLDDSVHTLLASLTFDPKKPSTSHACVPHLNVIAEKVLLRKHELDLKRQMSLAARGAVSLKWTDDVCPVKPF